MLELSRLPALDLGGAERVLAHLPGCDELRPANSAALFRLEGKRPFLGCHPGGLEQSHQLGLAVILGCLAVNQEKTGTPVEDLPVPNRRRENITDVAHGIRVVMVVARKVIDQILPRLESDLPRGGVQQLAHRRGNVSVSHQVLIGCQIDHREGRLWRAQDLEVGDEVPGEADLSAEKCQ